MGCAADGDCSAKTVCNDVTGRCVLRAGKAGKAVLERRQSANSCPAPKAKVVTGGPTTWDWVRRNRVKAAALATVMAIAILVAGGVLSRGVLTAAAGKEYKAFAAAALKDAKGGAQTRWAKLVASTCSMVSSLWSRVSKDVRTISDGATLMEAVAEAKAEQNEPKLRAVAEIAKTKGSASVAKAALAALAVLSGAGAALAMETPREIPKIPNRKPKPKPVNEGPTWPVGLRRRHVGTIRQEALLKTLNYNERRNADVARKLLRNPTRTRNIVRSYNNKLKKLEANEVARLAAMYA